MDAESDAEALGEVKSRLAHRFPHADAAVIERAVTVAPSELTGPLGEFVPVLVEHLARDRLSILAGPQ